MPEAPKEVVPEKKVPLVPPKKPEVPPAKGSHPHATVWYCLFVFTLSNHQNTNIFKVPEVPKAAVPEQKVPEAIPPKPESSPPEGNNETLPSSVFKKKNSLLSVINIFLQKISYTLVNSGGKMSLCL